MFKFLRKIYKTIYNNLNFFYGTIDTTVSKETEEIRKECVTTFVDGDLELVEFLLRKHSKLIFHSRHDKEKIYIMDSFNNFAYWEYARKKVLEDLDISRLTFLIKMDLFDSVSVGEFIADHIVNDIYHKDNGEKILSLCKTLIERCIESGNVDLIPIFFTVFKECSFISCAWIHRAYTQMQMIYCIESLQILIETNRVEYDKIDLSLENIKTTIQHCKNFIECLGKIEDQLTTASLSNR